MNMYVTQFGSMMIRITLHSKSHAIIEAFQNGSLVRMRKYEVGDQAEYHKISNYDRSNFGPIINITGKNLIVRTREGEVKHLRPEQFGWHNWDFDVNAEIVKSAHL